MFEDSRVKKNEIREICSAVLVYKTRVGGRELYVGGWFYLEQATKAQRVSRGIALPFHDLGT